MFFWLTEDADIVCSHQLGLIQIEPTQEFVTIEDRLVLVEPNPENRPIRGCPNIAAAVKPCQHTLKVDKGYSVWIRIEDQPVVRADLSGLTDGTPPGTVKYQVRQPGQNLNAEEP